jgi:hypothetical protein
VLFNPSCNDYDEEVCEDTYIESERFIDNSEAENIDIGSQDTITHSYDNDSIEDDSEEISVEDTVRLPILKVISDKKEKKRKYRLRQRTRHKQKSIRINEAIDAGVCRKVSEVALEAKIIAGKRRVKKIDPRRVRFSAKETEDNPLIAIHKLYGHLSESRIKLAYKKNLITDERYCYEDIKDLHLPLCPDCMKGRMKSFPSEGTTNHPWKLLQKVAMDYKGKFKKKSKNGYSGFYLFSDYFSDYVWAYPVKHKSEQAEALQAFYRKHIESRRGLDGHELLVVLQCDQDSVTLGSQVKRWLL